MINRYPREWNYGYLRAEESRALSPPKRGGRVFVLLEAPNNNISCFWRDPEFPVRENQVCLPRIETLRPRWLRVLGRKLWFGDTACRCSKWSRRALKSIFMPIAPTWTAVMVNRSESKTSAGTITLQFAFSTSRLNYISFPEGLSLILSLLTNIKILRGLSYRVGLAFIILQH